MANRNYSSVARAATITASVSGSSTTLPVSETTGFPTVPYTLVVDPGRTAEEVITVTAQVGLTLTVQRGQDGTTAVPHDAGATVRHMATARDFREPAEHIDTTAGVHGVNGSLVGDIDGQTLDNKTFQAIGTDHTAIVIKQGEVQSAPLLVFQEPGGNPVLTYSNSGGLVASGSQTLRPTASGSVPLTVQGVSGQAANLVNFQASGGSNLSYIDSAGKFNGGVSGDISGVLNGSVAQATGQSVFSNTTNGGVPLVARVPGASTVSAFAVRDTDTNSSKAGVWGGGGTTPWQLYHGGDTGNLLPYKVRVGSVGATIAVGTSSTVVTANIASSGFTQAPFVVATVSTSEDTGPTRRVSVQRLPPTNNTEVQFRIFQTEGAALTTLGNYSIQYIAIQMTPSNAAG